MNSYLYCCGYLHKCRTYCIGVNKLLQFTDECAVCGSCIAQIVKIVNNKPKVVVRKKNEQAVLLLQRYLIVNPTEDVKNGTFANSLIYYNNRGEIFDFNNQKVGTNDDFVENKGLLIGSINDVMNSGGV